MKRRTFMKAVAATTSLVVLPFKALAKKQPMSWEYPAIGKIESIYCSNDISSSVMFNGGPSYELPRKNGPYIRWINFPIETMLEINFENEACIVYKGFNFKREQIEGKTLDEMIHHVKISKMGISELYLDKKNCFKMSSVTFPNPTKETIVVNLEDLGLGDMRRVPNDNAPRITYETLFDGKPASEVDLSRYRESEAEILKRYI